MKSVIERTHELIHSDKSRDELCRRMAVLEHVCDRMLTDYLLCAGDKYLYVDALKGIERTDFDTPILKRIEDTKDGMRIRMFIDRLHEIGVDV